MRISTPQPITLEGGNRAILLLHGFTGSTHQLKQLGIFLNTQGYTVHIPLYPGHGQSAETLMNTTPEQWWTCAEAGYLFLQEKGYTDISVLGISMGGVFACRLALLFPVTSLITLCTPMIKREENRLKERLNSYAKIYKELEGKTQNTIQTELEILENTPFDALNEFLTMTEETQKQLANITVPTLVIQGCLDETVYQESAVLIFDSISAKEKEIRWYEHSGHIITTDKEKTHVFADISTFLEKTVLH